MSGEPPSGREHRQHQYMLALLAGAALLLLGIGIGWSVWDSVWSSMRPVTSHLRVYRTPPATPVPAAQPTITPSAPAAAVETSEAIDSPPITAPVLGLQAGRASWELQLDALLESKLPERQKAVTLLRRLRSMPPEAFATVTQELVDRLPDRDYAAVLPVLLSPDTHGAVESVLYADLLERPDSITLPALLSLIRTPSHPFAHSARESLALLVGEDHGDEWSRWERAVEQVLSKQVQR